jgi:hypothetical protein
MWKSSSKLLITQITHLFKSFKTQR